MINEGQGRDYGQDGLIAVTLGGPLKPWGWSSNGWLAVTLTEDPPPGTPIGESPASLWALDARGVARKVGTGRFSSVNWAPDGETLYAVDEQPDTAPLEQRGILAINRWSGSRRAIFRLDTIARQLAVQRPYLSIGALRGAVLSPNGCYFVLWLGLATLRNMIERRYPVIVDTAGRLLWTEDLEPLISHEIGVSWSPDSTHLAYVRTSTERISGLWLVTVLPDRPATAEILQGFDRHTHLAWSSGGFWLAADAYERIFVFNAFDTSEYWSLPGEGRWPAWRPRFG